ncbi:MAG TPA: integrin alpha [Anaerolineae bacterium]
MNSRKRVLWRTSLFAFVLVVLAVGTAVIASNPIAEPDAVIIHSFSGEQVGDGFGWVGADLGDIDGDGVHDFIIPAPFYVDEDGQPAGKVYVYSGRDGALLNTVMGSGAEFLGYSATMAGDVNGDGVSDYVIGGVVGSHAVVYSGADHSLLLDLHGAGGDGFGFSVAGAGDVDGDGHDDVIVGATNAGVSFPLAGRVYLFSGQDGSIIWTQDGQGENYRLGAGAGLVGDVNGDSIPDQVAAAPGVPGEPFGGEAYIFSGVDGAIIHTLKPVDPESAETFGQFFASGAGDFDGDGTPDVFIGDYGAELDGVAGTGRAYVFSGATGRRLHLFNGREPGGGFGPGRAISDVDGDGYGDVVVGAWTSSRGAPNGGMAFIISGRHPGKVLQTITGAVPEDSLGVDALSVGDQNDDGRVDYMVTAVGLSFAGTDVGHVYVVAGQPK